MRFEPRKYQSAAVTAWMASINDGYNSVIAVPTGAGKTVILCELIEEWLTEHPDDEILVLSHTQEILVQDTDALLEFFPSFGVGVYSAGLGRKEICKITVAGIQSVYKKPELFEGVRLCIIDEVHTINHTNNGMYRTFLGNVGCQVAGMSATVFRMGHGYIYKGKDTLFNALAYDLTSIRNFNRLVKEGYLTKLISQATDTELDSTLVKRTAADYNLKDLAKAHNRDSITDACVKETIRQAKDRKKWLVFAIDIEHAKNIAAYFRAHGIAAEELHTKMTTDREATIDRFKYGYTKALVSVGMVTTGFDAPNVDLIVLLRPTLSSVLHVQMVGRGLRVYPGKSDCLVLDFAGNTLRLGPINNPIIPKRKRKGDGTGEAPAKKCPKCSAINFTMARYCEVCGHEFVFTTRLGVTPDSTNIVASDEPRWLTVTGVMYDIHQKFGKPDSLKVTYLCGLTRIQEWIFLDYTGYAKYKADNWVKFRDPGCRVFTTQHVFSRREFLKVPKQIKVDMSGKYKTIKESKF